MSGVDPNRFLKRGTHQSDESPDLLDSADLEAQTILSNQGFLNINPCNKINKINNIMDGA